MKNVLVLTLVGALALSVACFGWERLRDDFDEGLNGVIGAHQNIDIDNGIYPLDAYIGLEFLFTYVDMSPWSLAGNLILGQADLWPWGDLSGRTLVDGLLIFGYRDAVDVALSMNSVVDYAPLPTGVRLEDWRAGAEIFGYIGDWLSLNAGVSLQYLNQYPGFATNFFFGFDAEW